MHSLVRLFKDQGITAIHLRPGHAPVMRCRGRLIFFNDVKPFKIERLRRLILEMMKPEHRTSLEQEGSAEFSVQLEETHCFHIKLSAKETDILITVRSQ